MSVELINFTRFSLLCSELNTFLSSWNLLRASVSFVQNILLLFLTLEPDIKIWKIFKYYTKLISMY